MNAIIPSFADRLRRYGAMKGEHARKRFIFLRKPATIACRPRSWLRRLRPGSINALPATLGSMWDSLARSGFASADNVVDSALSESMERIVAGRLGDFVVARAGQVSARKNFWQPLLTDEDLRSSGPFVRYALTPHVIALVTAYLGQVPFLSRLELVVTQPTEGKWKVSQLWHRDYNDGRMVKLFTYLSDVPSATQGPFVFIPADRLSRGYGPMFPIHKTDEAMARITELASKQEVLGPKGTAFFVDTHRCFHCGSRILDGNYRIAYIATYTTGAPYYAYDNEVVLDGELSAVDRMVLRA